MTSPDAPTPWQSEAPTASSRLLPPGLVFSDTPSRVTAYFLDGVAITPVYYIVFALLGIDLSAFGLDPFLDRNLYVLASLMGLLANAVYFVWFWSGGRRATPAQRLFGIQVANAFDGKPLTVGQAFGRWAALGQWMSLPFILPFFAAAVVSGIVAAIWNLALLLSTIVIPTRQGLHDRFAGSWVVRPAGVGNRWAVGCLAVLIVLILLEAAFLIWTFWAGPSPYLPPGYWDRFARWMWPS